MPIVPSVPAAARTSRAHRGRGLGGDELELRGVGRGPRRAMAASDAALRSGTDDDRALLLEAGRGGVVHLDPGDDDVDLVDGGEAEELLVARPSSGRTS